MHFHRSWFHFYQLINWVLLQNCLNGVLSVIVMIQPTVPVVEAAPCEAIELPINTSVIKTFHFPENFPSLQFSFDYAEINMFEYKYDMRGTRGQNFVRIKCSEVRERCKKKGKKLTNVSVMYVCMCTRKW